MIHPMAKLGGFNPIERYSKEDPIKMVVDYILSNQLHGIYSHITMVPSFLDVSSMTLKPVLTEDVGRR